MSNIGFELEIDHHGDVGEDADRSPQWNRDEAMSAAKDVLGDPLYRFERVRVEITPERVRVHAEPQPGSTQAGVDTYSGP